MYLRWAFNQGMTTITVQYSFDGLVYIDAHVASTSYFFASQPPDQFGLSCEGLGGGNKIVYFDLQEERYA
jgi:hypothetical protein